MLRIPGDAVPVYETVSGDLDQACLVCGHEGLRYSFERRREVVSGHRGGKDDPLFVEWDGKLWVECGFCEAPAVWRQDGRGGPVRGGWMPACTLLRPDDPRVLAMGALFGERARRITESVELAAELEDRFGGAVPDPALDMDGFFLGRLGEQGNTYLEKERTWTRRTWEALQDFNGRLHRVQGQIADVEARLDRYGKLGMNPGELVGTLKMHILDRNDLMAEKARLIREVRGEA